MRLGAGHGAQQGVELALQGGGVLLPQGVAVILAQAGQCGIFQTFTHANQTRQTHAIEVFRQAVDGHSELDEVFKPTFGQVVGPPRLEDVESIIDGMGQRSGHEREASCREAGGERGAGDSTTSSR